MATNLAEVLTLAARPTPCDNDERTWLEFRDNLESCLTPVSGKYVAFLEDAESQTVVNVAAGTDETPVLIRELSHTRYALLATDHGTNSETGATSATQKRVRSLETAGGGKRTKDTGSKIVASCAATRNGGNIRWTSTRTSRRQSWVTT